MKNIVVLSYYFYPDLSAGSFRNTALVKEFSKQVGDKAIIHVLTTQPNRYKSFSDKALEEESWGDNVKISRIVVPPHTNGFMDQINSYRFYYRAGLKLLKKKKKVDLVYASSSRLFTAYLGKVLAKRFKCPLYLDIRDIFVDTIADVLKSKPIAKPFILKFLEYFVERPTFRAATHINLVSEGFKQYFVKRTKANFSYFPNGIDEEFIDIRKKNGSNKKVITYAGNIGEGQGLEKIVPETARLLGDEYLFKIIGDGGTRNLLSKELHEHNITNVELVDPVKRNDLRDIYSNSDFLFLHLNNYKAFEKVLPSKIFEYGATNLPLVAGVGGYAKEFIDKNVENSFTFEPCNSSAFADWIKSYHYKLKDRQDFVLKYNRITISKNLAASILSYL